MEEQHIYAHPIVSRFTFLSFTYVAFWRCKTLYQQNDYDLLCGDSVLRGLELNPGISKVCPHLVGTGVGESVVTVKLATWAQRAAAKARFRKRSSESVRRSRGRGHIGPAGAREPALTCLRESRVLQGLAAVDFF